MGGGVEICLPIGKGILQFRPLPEIKFMYPLSEWPPMGYILDDVVGGGGGAIRRPLGDTFVLFLSRGGGLLFFSATSSFTQHSSYNGDTLRFS